NTLFKIDLEKVVPHEMLQQAKIKQIQTNDAEIEKPLSSDGNPVIVKASGERASTGGTIIHVSDKDAGPVIGRNDPCPCGSGKKYKKCCG
ncbi:MAG: SEC-C metal-binding domain-containing protein, partial [Candidatus Peregrinibacteria bacterium]|nr:SEC-C metal-binding domain-containing protein [Candidatus Peregrinibacteria bacterium]